jgi:predicted  nucleic acid-binding Zn-ribbon protein
LKTKLESTQKAYNDAKDEYETIDKVAYTGVEPTWPDLNTLVNTDNFNTDAALFESTISVIETNQLKNLREELKKKKGGASFQNKVHEIKGIYKTIEKLVNDALSETTNYNNIWGAVTTPKVGVDALKNRIEQIKKEAQTIATQTGNVMKPIDDFISQIESWKTTVQTKASVVQRKVEGDALQQEYNAVGVRDTVVENAIDNFRNASTKTQKELTDEQIAIQDNINNLKTGKDEAAKKEQEKKITQVVKVFATSLKDKNVWDSVLTEKYPRVESNSSVTTEFKTLLSNKDEISVSRAAAGEIALSLKNDILEKRKLLAFSQMFV